MMFSNWKKNIWSAWLLHKYFSVRRVNPPPPPCSNQRGRSFWTEEGIGRRDRLIPAIHEIGQVLVKSCASIYDAKQRFDHHSFPSRHYSLPSRDYPLLPPPLCPRETHALIGCADTWDHLREEDIRVTSGSIQLSPDQDSSAKTNSCNHSNCWLK